MAALMIVEILEVMQFSAQVISAPERHMIEILSPDCADESFYKGMRERDMRHGLNFAYLEHSRIGLPARESC